jgi:PAS domain S-box-containing protein
VSAIIIGASPDKLTFQSPELWVYLLGLSVLLTIALRRVLARQTPLKDEVFMKTVAVEHVQSGVAWARSDGTVGSVNASLATTLSAAPRELVGRDWYDLFAQEDRQKLEETYSQMLLLGKATVETRGRRMDNTYADLELLMVAVHNHKMRFVGHHCLVVDRTREKALEAQVAELTKNTERQTSAAR